MAGQQRLQGIFTPNMVPLDERAGVNEAELRRYIDWMIDRGVHGLYPNGSTSEFTRFTPEERRRIIEITVDQTAGRVPVLAGAAEANARETLRACEHYHRLGVRAVAIVSPYYYRLSADNVYAYFKEIGQNTPVDVTLYNIPMFASPIDVPTVQRLSEECPKIVAIKDSSGDLPQMTRLIEAVRPNRPDFSFLTGWDSMLMPMLLMGCDGGTNASSGVVPELTRKLYDLTKAGQIDEAVRLQYRVRRLFDAMLLSADFPEGFRVGVGLRGFRMGAGRQPLSDDHKRSLEKLRISLRDMLASEGLADEPVAAGSPAAPFDPQQVRQIVESVVVALQHRSAT
jgi:dihydrodipicolinate synthase/N-acetylneuraminate lyase